MSSPRCSSLMPNLRKHSGIIPKLPYDTFRMVMLLRLASLACSSEIVIDDEKCVAKSFPDFDTLFA